VFDDDSEHIGLLVAAHAAVAFAESRRTVQLNEAIMTRDGIGQAKGILMERHKITSQQASRLLTTASNRTNTRLTEDAERLVTSGAMRINPSRGPPGPHSAAADHAPPQRARHRSRQLRSRLPASAPALLSRPREGTRNPAVNTTTRIAPHTTATLVPPTSSGKFANDSASTPISPRPPRPVAR